MLRGSAACYNCGLRAASCKLRFPTRRHGVKKICPAAVCLAACCLRFLCHARRASHKRPCSEMQFGLGSLPEPGNCIASGYSTIHVLWCCETPFGGDKPGKRWAGYKQQKMYSSTAACCMLRAAFFHAATRCVRSGAAGSWWCCLAAAACCKLPGCALRRHVQILYWRIHKTGSFIWKKLPVFFTVFKGWTLLV